MRGILLTRELLGAGSLEGVGMLLHPGNLFETYC